MPAGLALATMVRVQAFELVGELPVAFEKMRLVPDVPGPVPPLAATALVLQAVPVSDVSDAVSKLAPLELTPADALAAQVVVSSGESQISIFVPLIKFVELTL